MALSPAVAAATTELKRQLARRFGDRLARVALFGSWARGEAHEASDVDVIVLVRDLQRSERRQVIDLAADLWMDTGVRLAPLVMSVSRYRELLGLERLVALDIEREGIPL